MSTEEIEDALKDILKGTYGGPSLSYEDGLFIIYEWADAPCETSDLVYGDTLENLITNYRSQIKCQQNS